MEEEREVAHIEVEEFLVIDNKICFSFATTPSPR